MIEEIKDSYILEGIEIGEARGGLKYRIQDILALLQFRFVHVPEGIVVELNKRTDLIALQSLFALAYQCDTLDEFADGLK